MVAYLLRSLEFNPNEIPEGVGFPNGERTITEAVELRADAKGPVEPARAPERDLRPDGVDPVGPYLFLEALEVQTQQVDAAVDRETRQTIGHLRHRIDELAAGQFADVRIGKLTRSRAPEPPDSAAGVRPIVEILEKDRLGDPDLTQDFVSNKKWRYGLWSEV